MTTQEKPTTSESALVAQNIYKTFRTGQREKPIDLLKGVSLEIKLGESVAITGKSGSGKSTLLSILAGFERADRGVVRIDRMEVTPDLPDQLEKLRSQHIGMVFQNFHLIPVLTALENVQIRLESRCTGREAKEKSLEILDRVGLRGRAHHLPSQLSGGEQQRVAIARAIAIRPKILFADEPSGNLDSENAEIIEDLLFKEVINQECALVLVTHDHHFARRCDRVLRLHQGILEGVSE